jgi:high-affinity Fe2+/Pb2+ permease
MVCSLRSEAMFLSPLKILGLCFGLLILGLLVLPIETALQGVGLVTVVIGLGMLSHSVLTGVILIAVAVAMFAGGTWLRVRRARQEAHDVAEAARRGRRSMDVYDRDLD